jgi:hypothetical protein
VFRQLYIPCLALPLLSQNPNIYLAHYSTPILREVPVYDIRYIQVKLEGHGPSMGDNLGGGKQVNHLLAYGDTEKSKAINGVTKPI